MRFSGSALPSAPEGRSLKRRIPWGTISRLALAFVFLSSAVAKLSAMNVFAAQVASYGLVQSGWAVSIAAWLTVVVELGLAGALLFLGSRRWILLSTMAIIAGFTALILYGWIFTGLSECGCFGDFIQMSPGLSMLKNGVLVALAFAAWPQTRTESAWRRWKARRFTLGFATGVVSTIVVAFAALVCAAFVFRDASTRRIESNLSTPLMPGTAMDYSWNVKSLDGANYAMANARGRPLFITFVSPMCGSCRAQLPGVERLYRRLRTSDIGIMSIFVGAGKESRVLIEEEGYTFPSYTTPRAGLGTFMNVSTPSTVIVSRDGRIILHQVGPVQWDDEACAKYLEALADDSGTEGTPPEVESAGGESPGSTALNRS